MSSPEIKDPKTTENVAPAKTKLKMVKIKALCPIRLSSEDGQEHVINEGTEAMVTEEEAKFFCDTRFAIGHKDFSGYRTAARETLATRAVRVAS